MPAATVKDGDTIEIGDITLRVVSGRASILLPPSAKVISKNGRERLMPPDPVSPTTNQVRAFTLIELLVVVLVVGVMIGILLPPLSRAVRKAKLASEESVARQQIDNVTVTKWGERENTVKRYLKRVERVERIAKEQHAK